ncbi:MAG: alkaline phosphatase family protein [Acidobacteriaceae bacterium]|nr:alkaline phosphatase family protein [Acidobacteriaceae bacterium]
MSATSGTDARLVFIAWHGADWRSIHPLVDAGLMPNLNALMERGVAGNLKPSGPAVPALLWNSISTGKSADEHGVLSGFEPDPLTGSVRPAGNSARRVKALWNIAMQSGLITHLVGWSGSHPAEKLNGSCVTPDFVRPLGRYDRPWPVPSRTMWPERLKQELAELRFHVGELTAEDLRPFIPRLDEIDQEADRRVVAFADTLAQTISTHAIATWLMEHEPWNVMTIGWNGLQRACQLFMRYAPPQMPAVSADECARYGEVVRAIYCYYDALLGRVMQLADPEATIAIVSAAGFRTGDERPISAALQKVPMAWYRPYGLFCLAGPQIVSDELVHGVTMYDVVPTLLHALKLPAGSDMPGRVIAEAFRESREESRIPSWEEVPGECGMEPRAASGMEEIAAANMNELRALGYTDSRADEALARVKRDRIYNAALVHLSRQRFAEARAALLQLDRDNEDGNLALFMAYCHYRCRDFSSCKHALQRAPREGLGAAYVKVLESYVASAEGNTTLAASAIAAAERIGFDRPVLQWIAGSMYACLGKLGRAEEALRTAVNLDPSFEPAHALLARVLAARGKTDEATQTALDGLSIDYSAASSHSAFGIALAQSGQADAALKAFEASLTFDPHLQEAIAWQTELKERVRASA